MNVHQIIRNTRHLSPTEKAPIVHCLIHKEICRACFRADRGSLLGGHKKGGNRTDGGMRLRFHPEVSHEVKASYACYQK
uniref:Uncharacterized protein n=1 Tax=Candidatus Kentrum sp. SD TaxID=2126332 RepID=A0A450YX08_9GAMM|nr:MAG: hypothetical protein BECKSD772F_GA0070984_106214 [Candidatus Kentron sp. SD]VFK46056.1 MAG: hypothetical protein BECKSD772E_GA0070983_106613 [Candidatus Kentron sp. SD]VFK79238.1 MAG: hypothetical protein BECKSD772D_GA0070982_104118 [Candidatus Kentron sp. SD]